MCPATLEVRVGKVNVEATDTVSVELLPVDDEPLPAFDAGAHISLHLPNNLVRSYSLVNPTDARGIYVLGILRARESRGGSAFIHDRLRAGDKLTISRPINHFPLDEIGRRFVLIAGGIGVTAIYSMAQRLAALGKSVEMLYSCRSREHSAWLDQLLTLGISLKLHFDLDEGGPPDIAAYISGRDPETRFYCCGPSPMLIAFEEACARQDYKHCHIERFTAAPSVAEHTDGVGYEVQLARSGKLLRVEPGTRLIDALRAGGVDIPSNCEQGICATCEVTVIEGDIEHRDSVLTESERKVGKSMMACVSGCKGGRLVLDC